MGNAQIRQAFDPDTLHWLILLPLAILFLATLEGLVKSFWLRQSYDWKAFATTLGDTVGRRAIDSIGFSIAAPVFLWAFDHRIATLPLSTTAAFVLLFVGQEFCYYWYHRAAHRVRWFWASHAVHHSPNELNLAAALRLGWTGKLTGTALFFAPLVWLGFPPLAVSLSLVLNLLYQFWIHAPWMPKLGPLEWVLNTPTHHKVHHASNPEYLDKNFGGVLIVFDRMFGTYADERREVKIKYGLTRPITSYNPVTIALHEWVNMVRDIYRAPTWRKRVAAVFGPPN